MRIIALLATLLLALPTQAQFGHRSNPGDPKTAGQAITTAGASNCPGTGCVTIQANGVASVFITISGTWVAPALSFMGSNDNWVTTKPLQAFPYSASFANVGTPVNSTSANGDWVLLTGGFREVGVFATTFTSNTSMVIRIDADSATPPIIQTVGLDPCLSTGVSKLSVPINITTAVTTQLVALAAGQSIYVCGYSISTTGATTTTTAQLEYGTGALCGTGTTVLTGQFAQSLLTSAVVVVAGGPMILRAPSGNALCLVSAGTTPSIQGHLTYVQQ